MRGIGKFIERKLTAKKCKGFSYVKSTPPKPKAAKISKPSRRKEVSKSKRISGAKKSYRGRRKPRKR